MKVMGTNFKGTKGECKVQYNKVENISEYSICIDAHEVYGDSYICLVYDDIKESHANAQLIADAFNVRQQINVDLPELLKQRNELLSFIKEYVDLENNEIEIHGGTKYPLLEKAEQLINKIERK